MIKSCATPRAVGTWITIVSAILALGCGTKETEKKPNAEPEWNTPLPPGVSADPVTFHQRVDMIKPTGELHKRSRAATCDSCTVEVSIQAIYPTRTINPDRPPARGAAVAHIQNLDSTKTESYYGFLPRAKADYYFWVDKRTDVDSARITVLEVPKTGGTVRAGLQKNLAICHRHLAGYSGPPDADFLEYKGGACTVTAAAGAKISEADVFTAGPFGTIFARMAAKFRQPTSMSQGGWIDCNSGCCT